MERHASRIGCDELGARSTVRVGRRVGEGCASWSPAAWENRQHRRYGGAEERRPRVAPHGVHRRGGDVAWRYAGALARE
ncbi:hypothetical protein E2562_037744 [Oryza meyeriana var. granulata]|uniref:Uncharacterized protein n=1 Tax=Oryza meyeriana var. granulata TaxID=110450 RepID=A0A6G1C1Y4_9ORYZ|nr:hypothetical protein E2562_037744 [Oryza meyeriana var. granulata]